MNVDMMYEVADAIEKENALGEELMFNMETWGVATGCGTFACVAGTVNLLDARKSGAFTDFWTGGGGSTSARKLLDLSLEDGDHLFLGYSTGTRDFVSLSYINKNKHLVPDALRWMAEKETIDWWSALKAAECLREHRSKLKKVQHEGAEG